MALSILLLDLIYVFVLDDEAVVVVGELPLALLCLAAANPGFFGRLGIEPIQTA